MTTTTSMDRWRELTATIHADDLTAVDLHALLDLIQAAMTSRGDR